ncbi:3-deoxy-D-manno-octulosonic acid kinase [Lacimicrobium sp. SS2-24]|uniref:3-deoxy-D-manno-octulosonic acid kinase n=1 Tax=Lacimicrobium sp. SS2-24 TaxID=2005569 RepID=UPI00143C70C4|nr:3-deoxy-D-manno-octulosonic acid kinase [Lacimicrobium sp. SS2-24]
MGFREHNETPGHWFLFDQNIPTAVDSKLFRADYWQSLGLLSGTAKGRGTTVFVRPQEGEHWALRHYCRGGLIGRLCHDQFIYTGRENTRAWQELRLLKFLRQHNMPVPEPIAAHIIRVGWTYRADLITRVIPNSRDLHHILCERPLTTEQWVNTGKVIARLHQHQVYHHDLNIRNLMLDDQDNVWIIDFDKCRRRNGDNWKKQNLQRLHRSLLKCANSEVNWCWQESDFTLLLQGYQTS